MIFVTVGTHEQQFNRLIKAMDDLCKNKTINEEVFIQTGYSDYEPKYCKWSKLIPYNEMISKIEEARIVITHGGPASFIMPIQKGKIPIVVPRQEKYNEHVNNHQFEFVKAIEERMNNIIPIYDIKKLNNKILNYDKIIGDKNKNINSNNIKFCDSLEGIVKEMKGKD